MTNSSIEGLSEEARLRLLGFAEHLDQMRDALSDQYRDYVPPSVRAAIEFVAMGMLKAHIRIEHLTADIERMEKLHHMTDGEVPSSVKHTHWDHQLWSDLCDSGVPPLEAAQQAGSA